MKESKVAKAVGRSIQALRKARGLSQEEFGDKIGKTVNTVSNIETGKFPTDLETLGRVSEVLGVSPRDLFEGVPVQATRGDHSVDLNNLITLLKTQQPEAIRDIHALILAAMKVGRKTAAGRPSKRRK